MKVFFYPLLAFLFLFGCQEKNAEEGIVFENDTEPKEWIGGITIKDIPNAHSGSSASVIDSLHPYSLGLRKQIGKINNGNITSVSFSFWVYFKDTAAKANCVLSIDSQEKNKHWTGQPIEKKVKLFNKWVLIRQKFELPENMDASDDISLYVWNTSKEEILIDDLKIIFK